MARHSLVEFLIVTMIVLHVPISTASSAGQDDWHPSQAHARGASRKVPMAVTAKLHADEENFYSERNPINEKDPNMLQAYIANDAKSIPRYGNFDSTTSRDIDSSNHSSVSTRRAQLSTETTAAQADVTLDKNSYYDGEKIQVTYEVQEEATTEWPFTSWVGLFPHDKVDDEETRTSTWQYTDTMYGNSTGTVELTTRLLL
jgi:hypothetical protein